MTRKMLMTAAMAGAMFAMPAAAQEMTPADPMAPPSETTTPVQPAAPPLDQPMESARDYDGLGGPDDANTSDDDAAPAPVIAEPMTEEAAPPPIENEPQA